jgi:hypothetical protein
MVLLQEAPADNVTNPFDDDDITKFSDVQEILILFILFY